ncbi:MAG: endonuclease III domain-containing protein [Opitutales bacterium]
MTKKERADYIDRYLAERFPETPVPLDHRDAFTLLVAVLLSAQCTDKRVNEVTPRLFARASDPVTMAEVPVAEVEAIVRPCGLAPQKAKAIVGLSRALVADHGGEVPAAQEALESLPGVGRKTALVVRAQAFGEPAFPVDTHIHRLAQRWELTNGQNVRQTELDLCKVFPRETWNQLHLRIIFYGREECPARGCDGLRCPLCQTMFPRRKNPPPLRKS